MLKPHACEVQEARYRDGATGDKAGRVLRQSGIVSASGLLFLKSTSRVILLFFSSSFFFLRMLQKWHGISSATAGGFFLVFFYRKRCGINAVCLGINTRKQRLGFIMQTRFLHGFWAKLRKMVSRNMNSTVKCRYPGLSRWHGIQNCPAG